MIWSTDLCGLLIAVTMATCPYCEYEGAPASVEGHISALTDESHSGKLGSDCRDKIGDCDADVAGSDAGPPAGLDEPAELPSGLALVAASAVLVIVVLFDSTGSGGPVGEPDDGADQAADPLEGWA